MLWMRFGMKRPEKTNRFIDKEAFGRVPKASLSIENCSVNKEDGSIIIILSQKKELWESYRINVKV